MREPLNVDLLFLPLVPFVLLPPLAFVVAVLLARGAARRRHAKGRVVVRAVAVLWLLYGVYESLLWIWARQRVAPVRVDLLAIAPLLVVASMSALAVLWRAGPGSGAGRSR